jgi:hypothetical protein
VEFTFSKRADLQAVRIQKRWQRDADYKQTFANDLIDAETHLTTLPDTGTPWKVQSKRLIRRWLLPKCKCFLYYVHQPER